MKLIVLVNISAPELIYMYNRQLETYPCTIRVITVGDVSLLSGWYLAPLRSLLVEGIGLLRGLGEVDKVLTDVCVSVPILSWVVAIDFQPIFSGYRKICSDHDAVALFPIGHISLQIFVPHSRLSKFAQDVGWSVLLELHLDFAVCCGDDGVFLGRLQAKLVYRNSWAPVAVRAVGEGHSIRRSRVCNDLVFSRRSEHILHSYISSQQLGKDGEVVRPRLWSPEDEGNLIIGCLLQRIALQLLAFKSFIPVLRKDNLVSEVGWLDEPHCNGDLPFLSWDYPFLVGHEVHPALEEVGLDEGEVLEFRQTEGAGQELPFFPLGPVTVDQLFGVGHEVKVIIFIHLQVPIKKIRSWFIHFKTYLPVRFIR